MTAAVIGSSLPRSTIDRIGHAVAVAVGVGTICVAWCSPCAWSAALAASASRVGPACAAAASSSSWVPAASRAEAFATSSIEDGLGFLIRQALRAGWALDSAPLRESMVRRPLGPLDGSEISALSRLVTEGFRRWEVFHQQYSGTQRQIGALDPGRARWGDLERFAVEQLDARQVEGYAVLQFRFQDAEVVEASEGATVLGIAGRHFACGDFGGMPVLGSGPGAAARLGLNVDPLVDALRAAGLPERATGAAYVRRVDRAGLPEATSTPFGLLIYGRQGVRNQGGTFVEHSLDLVVAVVEPGHDPVALDGDRRAALLRNLLSSTLRREGVVELGLMEALCAADTTLAQQLRRPGEDRTMRYALFPLAAVVVD